MPLNSPTETNPPFTSPPTWPSNTSSADWEPDYRLRLLEAAVIYMWANPVQPPVVIQGTNPATTPLTVQAASGQSANVFYVKNFAGSVLLSVSPNGSLVTPNNVLDDGAGNLSVLGRIQNSRIQKRVDSLGSGANPTFSTDSYDLISITGLAVAITGWTLTGTPVLGDSLIIQITDNGTARAIAWSAIFEPSTVPLPTTTVAGALLMIGFTWNPATSKWRCVAVA